MFRLSLKLFNQIRPEVSQVKNAGSAQTQKFQQLFTQIAYGFDLEHPPQSVTLYRKAEKLYEEDNFTSAKLCFQDALIEAKKENCEDAVISLYEKQIKKTQECIKSAEKTKKASFMKQLGGFGTLFVGGAFYLHKRQS